jgi:phosphoglycerate dehydrogenase-like enzyme
MKKEVNILSTLNLKDEQTEQVRNISKDIHLTVLHVDDRKEISDSLWEQIDVLYTWDLLPEPDQAPNLRWVQFQSAGIDSFVNHPLLKKRDLIGTTMSGAITNQIAEYVVMAILAFGQKLPTLLQYQKEKKWPSESEKRQRLLPLELRHSTVGIVGYGSIGRQVARLLQPFNVEILAAKKDVMHPEDAGYTVEGMGDPEGHFFDRLYPIEALHSMIARCDFVVLALPLTSDTFHMMDAEAFEEMKPTAYVINVGRGGLIDQPALVQALKTKQIAGAALDVFEQEPLPKENPLWEMPNVILSPHISGLSQHLSEETFTLFLENLKRYMAGLPLHNQIRVDAGY